MIINTPIAEMPTLQQIYQTYESERRIRIVRLVAPLFGVVTIVFLVSMIVYVTKLPTQTPSFINNALPPGLVIGGFVVLGAGVFLYFYAAYAAFRNNVSQASNCAVAAILINTLAAGNLWLYTQGLGPFAIGCYMLTALVIVLVGVLARPRVTFVATLLMNAFVINATFFTPRDPQMQRLLNTDGILLCLGAVALQWCFAGIMMSSHEAHEHTLKELGDIRLAYERAKKLDEIKDQFIRNVNHELRNPVMALYGYVRLLQYQGTQLSGATQRDFIEKAHRAGTRLISLLNRILATSRLEQQTELSEPDLVMLKEVIIEAAQSIDPAEGQLDEYLLKIDMPDDFVVWADRVRLLQIFTNVLSNAAKYSPQSALVTVSANVVAMSEKSGNRWNKAASMSRYAEIRVRDLGMGIPPEQIPLLFQRFTRLPRDLTSSVSGSGLGLYICKTLVDDMNGKIWIESTGVVGEGTTICIQLPITPERDQPASE